MNDVVIITAVANIARDATTSIAWCVTFRCVVWIRQNKDAANAFEHISRVLVSMQAIGKVVHRGGVPSFDPLGESMKARGRDGWSDSSKHEAFGGGRVVK